MATEADHTSFETLDSALTRAAEAEASGDRRGAVRILHTEVVRQFGGTAQAFIRSGEQLAQWKHFDEADDVLLRGVEAFPQEPWIARGYAWVARWRGEHEVALARFADVRDRFPDFGDAHADFVQALLTLGQVDEAEAAATAAVEAVPGNFWVANMFARAAEARGDTAAALTRWQVVRTTWPDHPYGPAGELRALWSLGHFAEAGDLLASVGKPHPSLWGDAADLAAQAGEWGYAASWWERFRTARPDDEKGYVNGALALLRSGDAEAALRLVELARDRWPDSHALAGIQAELRTQQPTAAAPAGPEPHAEAEPAAPAQPAAAEQAPVSEAAKKPAPERSRGAFGWLGW